MCQWPEACGEWEYTDKTKQPAEKTKRAGCILNKYCGVKAQWKDEDTTFTCPEGENKMAMKLTASVAVAITLLTQM